MVRRRLGAKRRLRQLHPHFLRYRNLRAAHQSGGRLLPEKINENGLSATALELDVSKATLGYWLLKLGINVRRVALAPGETLEVKRAS